MEEPSVLDYLKAKLRPWGGPVPEISAGARPPAEPELPEALSQPDHPPAARVEAALAQAVAPAARLPWRSLAALALALLAQAALEPKPERSWQTGLVLYLFALAWLVLAMVRKEWAVAPLEDSDARPGRSSLARPVLLPALAVSLVLALGAFLFFAGNRFNPVNLGLLAAAVLFFFRAFWDPGATRPGLVDRARAFFAQPSWSVRITPQALLFAGAGLLVVFFRLYRLGGVPPEMVSDHAEKLLDVYDVLSGQSFIFFQRNTGREALQMYLTAGIALLFGTGLSFLSLKIGTALAGLLTLPYVYLLGKEVGNRRAGLLALVFAGIAYWPNVISRVGLRFPLYPLFVAPALYYLIRGLRRSSRNDFLLAGLFLGIGLHGYTPIRILPVVVVAAVLLYLLHRQPEVGRREALLGLVLVGSVSLILFLPLLRYSLENPGMIQFRALTRLGTVERPLAGPAWSIFLENLKNGLLMFGWNNGNIWLHSVVQRPALDVVSAALFHLGTVLLLARYIRRRSWVDLFLLLSIPLLLMPSILSLAFPEENPALNRAGGGMVPVFVIVGLCLDGLLTRLAHPAGGRQRAILAAAAALLLILISARQNYDLVFNKYRRAFDLASWNTSELGQVIGDYARSFGSYETAWVIPYPHWVDTRLVGMNAGDPLRDYALWPDRLAETVNLPGPKLFLVNPADSASLETLLTLYPTATPRLYSSRVENHDFWIYYVPSP